MVSFNAINFLKISWYKRNSFLFLLDRNIFYLKEEAFDRLLCWSLSVRWVGQVHGSDTSDFRHLDERRGRAILHWATSHDVRLFCQR